eukprot:scaffold48578_cov68-Attheya_sp.AAC.1
MSRSIHSPRWSLSIPSLNPSMPPCREASTIPCDPSIWSIVFDPRLYVRGLSIPCRAPSTSNKP